MRKILLLFVVFVSVSISAQRDVTKFLGIPVDGSKTNMVQKLKSKGFVYNSKLDILTGQFNDYNVEITVVTNNNKVSRIAVFDKYEIDESAIKIRFNKLCKQFERNSKYISFDEQIIPDDEDISYKMLVDNKRYEAVFYQKPITFDTLSIQQDIRAILLDKYSEDDLANPTDEIEKESTKIAQDIIFDILAKSPVWFMIKEEYGKYKIHMFYDNEYNKSDGDDL
ncbi:MAG: hypothetical protein IJQ60_16185 [Prevotella sp.]|nr:hypothetical protein [Prevotella sp.]